MTSYSQNPLACYEKLIEKEGFLRDEIQLSILLVLNALQRSLINKRGVLSGIFGQRPFNLYLWGAVGRGKTLLVDCLVQSLPAHQVKRIHFYAFMQTLHAAMKESQGQADPLLKYAQSLGKDLLVMVLDEFMVHDIVDAMLLKQLLQAFQQVGVTLVTTSNVPPGKLYEGGLQRSRFLSAIQFIEDHFKIIELQSAQDYRLRALRQDKAYFQHSEVSHEAMLACFKRLSPCLPEENVNLWLDDRAIPTIALANDAVWLDFNVICGAQRGPRDYLALSNLFHTVLIERVPPLDDKHSDTVRRFMMLVDAFYDRGVHLILVAEVSLDHLYEGTRFEAEWGRIHSRLIEMQSEAYHQKRHEVKSAI